MILSIIIINYKSEQFLETCLQHIHYEKPYEIIMVDNDQKKKYMQELQKKYSFKLIAPPKNIGFAKANNVEKAKGKYILTLNADIFLTPKYISACISFLEKNPKVASVQGKLLSEKNKKVIDSTGNVLTKSRFAYNENHKIKDKEIPSHEIFGVCAAAAIYRKKALEDIKINNEYFDNDFFAYLEDVDLDWRLRKKGWKSFVETSAVAFHIRETTTNHKYRLQQAIRNRYFMVLKNDSTRSMIGTLMLYTPLLFCIPNRLNNLKLIPKMLEKRKIIRYTQSVPDKKIVGWMVPTPKGAVSKLVRYIFQKN